MTRFELLLGGAILLGTLAAGGSLLIAGFIREVRAYFDRPDD